MSIEDIETFVVNANSNLLSFDNYRSGNNGNQRPQTQIIKNKEDIKKIEGKDVVAVIGKNKVGKSHVIAHIKNSYVNEDKSYDVVESSLDFIDSIMENGIVLILIVNEYGRTEQNLISFLNENKRKDCKLIVILNYLTSKSFTSITSVRRYLKAMKSLSIIGNEKEYFFVGDDGALYCLLTNFNYYHKKRESFNYLRLQNLIVDHLYQQAAQGLSLKDEDKHSKSGYQPTHCYYLNENNQFVIEIELCGKLGDLKVKYALEGIFVVFKISGNKILVREGQVLPGKNTIQSGYFNFDIVVPYDTVTISNFNNSIDYKKEDGVVYLYFNTLDKRAKEAVIN